MVLVIGRFRPTPTLPEARDVSKKVSKLPCKGSLAAAAPPSSRAGPRRRASTATSATTRPRTWTRPSPRSASAPAIRGSRPREMQVYTMEETNATTTQTLVDAAKRLVDELPEGTPADKVLEHWLASARRDDEARGVIWPTIPADILGQSGTAWQIFPNFQIGQGLTSALCYSARPDPGYDPDKCIFEVGRASSCIRKARSRRPNGSTRRSDDPDWRSVLPQDFSNMAAVQQGMKSLGFPGTKPNPYRERSTVNLHYQLSKYMGTGEPRGAFEIRLSTIRSRDQMRTRRDDAARTSTSTRCGRSTLERDKRLRPEGSTQYLELKDDFAEFYEVDPYTPVTTAHPDRRGHRRRGPRRRLRRPAGRRLPEEGRRRGRPGHRDGRRLRRRLVLEPLPGHPVRQRRLLLHPDARGTQLHSVARSSPTAPRSSSTAGASAKHFGLYDGAIFSTQVRDAALGRDDQALAVEHQPRRRHPRPVRGDGAGLVQPAEAARHPRYQGLRTRAHASTPRAGTTTTPAAMPTAACTSCADKRVALVGTGATGVQLVPHLGRDAKQLYVFQRTPSSVDVRGNDADRPGVGGVAAAGLAGGAQAQLPQLVTVRQAWCSASRIWCATSGPNSAAT